MNVTVLYGGAFAKRDQSLLSGRAVAQGLRDAGHLVTEFDVRPETLDQTLDRARDGGADVVFPVIHGEWGEDGQLQMRLEERGLAFVGSGSAASRLGMDKVETKRVWEKAGVPTPPWELVTDPALRASIRAPCVVKPVNSGTSLDVHICRTADEAAKAVRGVVENTGRALVEQFISGPELTIGLLEERSLDPIRIVPRVEFFDYEAKRRLSDAEHRFDVGLPAELVGLCRQLAERANAAVGARDLARVDMMIDGQTLQPYLLEINTLPGLTAKSLLPQAAAHR